MEKKTSSNTATIAALDYLLKLRIVISVLTLSAGLAVAGLGYKTHEILKNDRDRVSTMPSGVKIDVKALLSLTQTSLVMGANLGVGTLFMVVFLARRWHHPSPKTSSLWTGSLFQKMRPLMKMILDAEFFVVATMFSLLLTLKSNTETEVELNGRKSHDTSNLGVPGRYIRNGYFTVLIAAAWLSTSGYLLGFALEASSFVRYRRSQKAVSMEKF